jgi:mannose-1-phosphate guanylyltransferase
MKALGGIPYFAAAARTLLLDPRRTQAASNDPNHLIATIGCEDLIIIHTQDATLVCHKDRAESIKELHRQVAERFGSQLI